MASLSDTDKKILSDIDMYGWHVIKVPEDELGPSFGYSVGLYHSFNHPEIVIIGLELDIIHYLINKLGDQIRDGLIIQPGQFYSNIIENIDCYFTIVNPIHFHEYASYNEWFYNAHNFSLLQCIYPSIDGMYPWQMQSHSFLKQQPVLGSYPG